MLSLILSALSICLAVQAADKFKLPPQFVRFPIEKEGLDIPPVIGCPYGPYLLLYILTPSFGLDGLNYTQVLEVDNVLASITSYRIANVSSSDAGDLSAIMQKCLGPPFNDFWINA